MKLRMAYLELCHDCWSLKDTLTSHAFRYTHTSLFVYKTALRLAKNYKNMAIHPKQL